MAFGKYRSYRSKRDDDEDGLFTVEQAILLDKAWNSEDAKWEGDPGDPEYDDPVWTPAKKGWYQKTNSDGSVTRKRSKKYGSYREMSPGGTRFRVRGAKIDAETRKAWIVVDTLDEDVVMRTQVLKDAISKAFQLNRELAFGEPNIFKERADEWDSKRELFRKQELERQRYWGTTRLPKLMVARFNSVCTDCKGTIQIGDNIWWLTSNGWHYSCGCKSEWYAKLNNFQQRQIVDTGFRNIKREKKILAKILGIEVVQDESATVTFNEEKEPEPLFGQRRKFRGI